jgi:uncharacterized DUF497 family protein
MNYRWDPHKAAANKAKHGVDFADAVGVFEDVSALWQADTREYEETRYVAVGMDYLGRVLTVAFTFRGDTIRLISARRATRQERATYEQG